MYLELPSPQYQLRAHFVQLTDWAVKQLALGRVIYFRVRPWLQNAQATLCGNFIEADIDWLATLAPRYGWGNVTFVAFHEVGHLVDCQARTRRERELFADEVAGWLLRQAGVPLRDAIQFLRVEAFCTSCVTHPPVEERVLALRRGYGVFADLLDQLVALVA